MSDLSFSETLSNTSRIHNLERLESPNAQITLTRTSSFAVTTAGTVLIWQSVIRNRGFTWDGTSTVTIPTDGFYLFQTRFSTGTNVTFFTNLIINTVLIGYIGNTEVATNYHIATHMRYMVKGDTITVRVQPSVNATVNVSNENTLLESPLLHIVQLTSAVA